MSCNKQLVLRLNYSWKECFAQILTLLTTSNIWQWKTLENICDNRKNYYESFHVSSMTQILYLYGKTLIITSINKNFYKNFPFFYGWPQKDSLPAYRVENFKSLEISIWQFYRPFWNLKASNEKKNSNSIKIRYFNCVSDSLLYGAKIVFNILKTLELHVFNILHVWLMSLLNSICDSNLMSKFH